MNRELRIAVTLDRIGKFQAEVARMDEMSRPGDIDPVIWNAQIAGMKSVLGSLEQEYAELTLIRP